MHCQYMFTTEYTVFIINTGSLVGVSILILICTVLVHIVICWIRTTKLLRQGNTNSENSL